MAANEKDLVAAQARGLTGPMYDRLVLTRAKLEDLAKGLNQIADSSLTNVGRVVRYVTLNIFFSDTTQKQENQDFQQY